MSILKTTHSGSELIPVTSVQSIIDEIVKLGYTYDCNRLCYISNNQNMPYLILHQSNSIYVYVCYKYELSLHPMTYYNIISMSDLFNFIKDLELHVNS